MKNTRKKHRQKNNIERQKILDTRDESKINKKQRKNNAQRFQIKNNRAGFGGEELSSYEDKKENKKQKRMIRQCSWKIAYSN